MPKIFQVNWFRKDKDGKFLWPGFGDNLRVLEWMLKRVTGQADATETPIGLLPKAEELDTDGLHLAEGALDALLDFDADGWRADMKAVGEYLEGYGERLPQKLRAEQRRVMAALEQSLDGLPAPKKAAAAFH